MFDFPDTFKEDNEDYIVMGAMKKFIKCRPSIKGKLGDNRKGLIKTIVEYANESEKAKEDVLTWVDSVVREGVKDLYVKKLTNESQAFVKDIDKVYEKIESELQIMNVNHLCSNQYSDTLSLVRFQVEDGETLVYTFFFCQVVYIYDGINEEKKRLYPLCVDIYPNEGFIVGRGKPRQNMYRYNEKEFDPKLSSKLHAEYRILYSIERITELLGIQCKEVQEIGVYFKNCLYRLLNRYTNTPPEIVDLINNNREKIDSIINTVSNEICPKGNKEDILSDIMNLIEKYFSITYEDKTIFTQGREAYPLRILATDEEESKVDQKSAREHPLQSKALFFDNKKMMQKSKICDGIVFKFKRKNKMYFDDEFKVRINAKNNYCHIKFFEYTEEVDIQNVLQLFIDS